MVGEKAAKQTARINCNMAQNSISTPDSPLGEYDCITILQELETVMSEWYGIGMELGLKPGTLERISKGQGNIKDMFRNMILDWLKMNYDTARFGPPTWRRIVEAVRASAGGDNPALANQLARNHGVLIHDTQPRSGRFTVTPENAHPVVQQTGIWCCCGVRRRNRQVTQPTKPPIREEIILPERPSASESNLRSKEDGKLSQSYPPPRPAIAESNFNESLEKSKKLTLADPTYEVKDITKLKGYFGTLTTRKAEENLRRCGGNCYLIRYSNGEKCYVISVMRHDAEHLVPAIEHYTLNITPQNDHSVYEIKGTQKQFTDISELLEFYQTHPLTRSDRTIGKACNKLL